MRFCGNATGFSTHHRTSQARLAVESYVAAMRGEADLNLNRLTDRVGLVFDDDSLPEKLNHSVMLPKPERGEAIRQIVKELRGNAVGEIKASALRFDADR